MTTQIVNEKERLVRRLASELVFIGSSLERAEEAIDHLKEERRNARGSDEIDTVQKLIDSRQNRIDVLNERIEKIKDQLVELAGINREAQA